MELTELCSSKLERIQKIKCAEIFLCVKLKKWEFVCFYCTNSIYNTPLDFVLHLESHYNLENDESDYEDLEAIHDISRLPDIADEGSQKDEQDTFPSELVKRSPGLVPDMKQVNSEEINISFEKCLPTSEECQKAQEMMWVSAYYKKKLQHEVNISDGDPVFTSYSCDICHETFSDKFGIARHFKIGHKRMKCKYCAKTFNSRYAMSLHSIRHEKKSGDDPNFYCTICTRRFKEERSLGFHMRKHNGEEKAYICEICQKKFTRSSTLRVHIDKAHRNHKTFQCPECGKCLASSSELATHRRIHWVDKPNKCNLCDAQYVYPWQLKEHKWGHTGERPLQCTYCPKTFFRNKLLKQHENIHTGKINYPCRHCNKNFYQAAGRRAHEKHVHQVA